MFFVYEAKFDNNIIYVRILPFVESVPFQHNPSIQPQEARVPATEIRFNFPGFRTTANKDTFSHQIEIGRLEVGTAAFGLHLIRDKKLTYFDFLLMSVSTVQGVVLWKFASENYSGVGTLAKAGDDVVIALMGRGKEGKVEQVIPFSKFSSDEPLDVRKLTRMKILAAEFLGREHTLTYTEKALMAVDLERKQAAEEEQQRIDREARDAAREERTKRVLARGQITCFTADGKQRHGLPVLESE